MYEEHASVSTHHLHGGQRRLEGLRPPQPTKLRGEARAVVSFVGDECSDFGERRLSQPFPVERKSSPCDVALNATRRECEAKSEEVAWAGSYVPIEKIVDA